MYIYIHVCVCVSMAPHFKKESLQGPCLAIGDLVALKTLSYSLYSNWIMMSDL